MTNDKPTYWSIDADTYATWVNVLGTAAAGKLMAACAAYFFDGTEPDGFKLTKQARAMFDGERGRMERRRASATNGRKGGRRAPRANVENPPRGDVEKSATHEKSAGKPRKESGRTDEKSPKKQPPTQAPSRQIDKSRLTPIHNLNPNLNPQTPAPSGGGAGSGGSVTPAEFAAMLGAGLGYDVPTAYDAMLRVV